MDSKLLSSSQWQTREENLGPEQEFLPAALAWCPLPESTHPALSAFIWGKGEAVSPTFIPTTGYLKGRMSTGHFQHPAVSWLFREHLLCTWHSTMFSTGHHAFYYKVAAVSEVCIASFYQGHLPRVLSNWGVPGWIHSHRWSWWFLRDISIFLDYNDSISLILWHRSSSYFKPCCCGTEFSVKVSIS